MTATAEAPAKAAAPKKALFDLSTIVKIEAPRRPDKTFTMLLYGKPKVGKALGSHEPVLTPKGWMRIDSLTTGDFVYGVDGNRTEVLGVFPQGQRELFNVTLSDGGTVQADGEHIWTLVDTHSQNNWRTVNATTKQIAERLTFQNKWAYLPVNKPVQYAANTLPLEPYALGLLLGDGSFAGTTPTFTNPSEFLHSALEVLVPETASVQLLEKGDRTRTSSVVGIYTIVSDLKLNGLSIDKFIPEMYLYSSTEHRTALLRGLLDTDGYMDSTSIAFSTSSQSLKDNFVELVQSLGGVATVQTKPAPKYTYKGENKVSQNTAYVVRIRLPHEHGNPFGEPVRMEAWEKSSVTKRLPSRRIVSIESAGMGDATCIYVADPKHLFITKDYIVTHNTLLAGTAADVEALSPVLVLAVEDGSSVLAQHYEDIDVANVEDWKTAASIIRHVAEGDTKYKTIIIDTLGELQEQMLMDITKDKSQAMRIQDWGTILDNTVNVVKMLHRSPVNAIFITHADRTKDDSTGAVMTTPVLKGKASLGEVPKIVDIIGYLAIGTDPDTKENIRVLQTEASDKIDAGDRFGKLDSYIPNPNFTTIFAQLTAVN